MGGFRCVIRGLPDRIHERSLGAKAPSCQSAGRREKSREKEKKRKRKEKKKGRKEKEKKKRKRKETEKGKKTHAHALTNVCRYIWRNGADTWTVARCVSVEVDGREAAEPEGSIVAIRAVRCGSCDEIDRLRVQVPCGIGIWRFHKSDVGTYSPFPATSFTVEGSVLDMYAAVPADWEFGRADGRYVGGQAAVLEHLSFCFLFFSLSGRRKDVGRCGV